MVFSDFDVVEPELLFVSSERARVLTDKNVQGAPDLVVEVGSPATRRRDEKTTLQLYERFGVHEYWVVEHPAHAGLELSLADIFPET